MKEFKYFVDLRKVRVKVNSKKVNGILELIKEGVPTVPDPWMMKPEIYRYFLKNKKFPRDFLEELRLFLEMLKKEGKTLAYRPSVYSPTETGLDLYVKNKINIIDLDDVKNVIITSFNSIIRAVKSPEKIEFSSLMQTFYDSDKCGLLHTTNNENNIYIEAIFGQHSNLLTREGAEYDTYEVDKKTFRIVNRDIAKKTKTLVKSKSGLIHKKLSESESAKPVLNNNQIKELAGYALKLERTYEPQEVEWAVLVSGEIIIQGTRKLEIEKFQMDAKIKTIYPGDIEGSVTIAKNNEDLKNIEGRILVTDNLNVGFIMKAITKQKPVGVILTKGSIMSHAATVLREMKIPSFLIQNLKIKNKERIKLEKGRVKKI